MLKCKVRGLSCCLLPSTCLGPLREELAFLLLSNELLLLEMTGSSSTSTNHYSLTEYPCSSCMSAYAHLPPQAPPCSKGTVNR